MKKIIGKIILFLIGWKVDEHLPPEAQRAVVLAAPHTSNWDFFFVIVGFWVLGVPMKVAIKDDWVKFPFGLIIKPLGGLGINRGPKKSRGSALSQVDQMAGFFSKMDRIALVIAPEGTRRRTEKWKSGFYHIAQKAEVPLCLGYVDYTNKIAGIHHEAIHPTGNIDEDMKKIIAFYSTIGPKNPEQFILDKRYLPETN